MLNPIENQDFVVCRECGYQGSKLYRHIEKHGLTTEGYLNKYPSAPMRCSAAAQNQTATRMARRATSPPMWQATKMVPCPSCGGEHTVSKFMGPLHDLRCAPCKAKALAAGLDRFDGKSEPEDYVTCLDCGYQAGNLTSHVQHAHPDYRDRHPEALMVALRSCVRDKKALRGRTLSAETRQKMSENAGRWNKGLTKATHSSLAAAAEKMQARVPWNRGLTATTDSRIAEMTRKLRYYTGDNRPWDNGLAAGLTLADFRPFMDVDGKVDHHRIVEATGVSWVTVRKYIVDLGLAQTRRYIEDAADNRIIRIDKGVLEGFKLGNGKVSIGKAMSVTGHAFKTIQRECERHGLPTFHRHIRQTLCLDAVSEALGGLPYEMEWESMRFVNPPTGRRFRFDGYFPDLGLVVEFHGHQHYTFPNAFMPDEGYLSAYEALRERDRIKRGLIESSHDLTYFEVTEDEPYTDAVYLRGRLMECGFTP